MDVTLRQLELFRAVVVAGSITKASQRIGLSQPSLSQQLAKLEETLGVQLVVRNRTGRIALTSAGEFWYRSASDLLGRMDQIQREHEQTYRSSNVVLRMGITPALRGRFVGAVARIAQGEPGFVKFEMVYDMNSSALASQLRLHQINFAVLTETALTEDALSYATTRLFEDRLAWAVPASVPDEALTYSIRPDADPARVHPMLRNFVEMDTAIPTRAESDDWFRTYQPHARATLQAPTFASAVEFVAEGLATTHVPLSLMPNLSPIATDRLRLFQIQGITRVAVLAMHKHLQTHGAFARMYQRIVEFAQTDYAPAMSTLSVRKFEELLPPGPAIPTPKPVRGETGMPAAGGSARLLAQRWPMRSA